MRRPYRPAGTMATVVMALLILDALMVFPAMFLTWQLFGVLEDAHRAQAAPAHRQKDEEAANRAAEAARAIAQKEEDLEILRGFFGLGVLAVRIPLIIVFAMWIYRANWNARALGAKRMEFTPGWSVGWYFIPIANLFKPYLAMKETWKATQTPAFEDWRQAPSSGLLPLWWFLWIAHGILGQIAFRLSWYAETLDMKRLAAQVDLVSDFASLPLAFVALLLVRGLTALQEENYQLREQVGWPEPEPEYVEDEEDEEPLVEDDTYPPERYDRPYQ